MTEKQKKIVESYIRKQVRKKLNEDVQTIHTKFPEKIQNMFDLYIEQLSKQELEISENTFERKVSTAQSLLDKSLQIIMNIE